MTKIQNDFFYLGGIFQIVLILTGIFGTFGCIGLVLYAVWIRQKQMRGKFYIL